MPRNRLPMKYVLLLGLPAFWSVPALAQPPRPATPEQIKDMIKAAGDAEDYDKASFVYVLDEADVFVKESGLATTEACQVVKILTDAGVRSRSSLRWEFDPDTYRDWTSAFAEGSHFVGSWEEGARILFLGPSGDGMVATIAARRPYPPVEEVIRGCGGPSRR